MAIAILQGLQHKAMADRHECNECVIMKMPHIGSMTNTRFSDATYSISSHFTQRIYLSESCLVH